MVRDRISLALILIVALIVQIFSVSKLKTYDDGKLRLTVAPPATLPYFSFGYQEIIADLLWIRSIQDFDYCDRPQGQGDKGHIICSNQSWLYKQLDAVANLSPQFRMPMATGPLSLTVLISDYEGATKLFQKAITRFPKDWPIHYRAAYHAIIEEKKPMKAANLLKIAAEQGGPVWLYSLAGRMFVEGGAEDLGLQIAESLDGGDDFSKDLAGRIRKRVKERQSSSQQEK